ncbi:hypothetical protein MB02_14700 [Croceicoccus estronivorus]|uniref:hypothetical protein n=1 Tax=Croceicoccus estronivorus TaxID=1172626 RepID=UPI00082D27F4|nr:hypothetical protein [Croceicoccus estronivorus]OCC22677.1 hypothetical protein MB02_14700 [Croceicoccus estronivorus]
MNILETLRRTGGLSAISNRLEISPAESAQVADAFLPFLIAGFRRVFERAGQDGLLFQLESLGGEEMAQAVLMPQEIAGSAGDAALRLAFGSREGARNVEAQVRDVIELEPTKLRDAMRLLAMLLGGYLASRAEREEINVTDSMATLLKPNGDKDPLDAILPAVEG